MVDQLAGSRPNPETAAMAGAPAPEARPTLMQYHEKRNFSVTTEPEGIPDMSGQSFVIQEHHSHKLHFDLRLERDGVLKSWAVPRVVPEIAGERHLAIAVEDHPLEYRTFEGEIPRGEYGAGTSPSGTAGPTTPSTGTRRRSRCGSMGTSERNVCPGEIQPGGSERLARLPGWVISPGLVEQGRTSG